MNASWIPEDILNFDSHKFGLAALNAVLYFVVILVVAHVTYGLLIYLLRRMLVNRKGKHLWMSVKEIRYFRSFAACCFMDLLLR